MKSDSPCYRKTDTRKVCCVLVYKDGTWKQIDKPVPWHIAHQAVRILRERNPNREPTDYRVEAL